MAIADDFTVAVNGDIRHASGATHYTVLELHRFLQDLADNASPIGGDLVDITSSTPSERSTDNIITLLGAYNIDDTAAEYFYDGSITQASGATVYSGLKVLGAVNNTATQLMVIQDNALYTYTTTPASPFWGTQGTGGYNGSAASGVLMRCLIKSRTAGSDIDGKRIRVQARHWGDTYDFFNVTLGVGESVAAIGTTPDAQNNTAQGTVTAYTHVTNLQAGYQTINLNNGNGAQPYYSKWTYGANTSGNKLKGVWEFIKDMTGKGTAKSLYGLNGELFLGVTHELSLTTPRSGSFVATGEAVTWTGGGAGQLLAIDSVSAGTKMWIQLTKGSAPTTGTLITGAGGATLYTTGSAVARTIPKVFLGSYTGTVIGAFGIGFLPADLTASDTIQDLLGVTQTPPNNVTFTVSTLIATGGSEDYVLVGPKAAGDTFQFDQMVLQTTLASGSTTVVVTAGTPIPVDTPQAGTLRVQDNTGVYIRAPYTSWTGTTFTLTGTFGSAATAPKNVMVSYIDKTATDIAESFNMIYNAPRTLWVRVRNGKGTPIKTFENQASLGTGGGGIGASRISDM